LGGEAEVYGDCGWVFGGLDGGWSVREAGKEYDGVASLSILEGKALYRTGELDHVCLCSQYHVISSIP
jgi:hypothetical protein